MQLQQLIEALKKGIKKDKLKKKLHKIYPDLDFFTAMEFLKAQGLSITQKDGLYYLSTSLSQIQDEVFCIVDIETNGSKPENSQIIEIGAIKVKNGEVIDTFNEFVKADYIPEAIRELTGINEKMLKNAKTQKEVLRKFKEFLGDAIFVAHDSYFDFNYIKSQLKKEGLGDLLNPEICTLTLSKKTIDASRYGLKYLIEELNLPKGDLHRALYDAKATSEIMLEGFKHLPQEIQNTNDLITFAKGSKSIKNKKMKKKQIHTKN
ncbi:MAG: 3'-5' exonuclease [Epsilonproteobacteria bacterium]|nr:3'-5' exonuclease [Campylobacterota bacterium]